MLEKDKELLMAPTVLDKLAMGCHMCYAYAQMMELMALWKQGFPNFLLYIPTVIIPSIYHQTMYMYVYMYCV